MEIDKVFMRQIEAKKALEERLYDQLKQYIKPIKSIIDEKIIEEEFIKKIKGLELVSDDE